MPLPFGLLLLRSAIARDLRESVGAEVVAVVVDVVLAERRPGAPAVVGVGLVRDGDRVEATAGVGNHVVQVFLVVEGLRVAGQRIELVGRVRGTVEVAGLPVLAVGAALLVDGRLVGVAVEDVGDPPPPGADGVLLDVEVLRGGRISRAVVVEVRGAQAVVLRLIRRPDQDALDRAALDLL